MESQSQLPVPLPSTTTIDKSQGPGPRTAAPKRKIVNPNRRSARVKVPRRSRKEKIDMVKKLEMEIQATNNQIANALGKIGKSKKRIIKAKRMRQVPELIPIEKSSGSSDDEGIKKGRNIWIDYAYGKVPFEFAENHPCMSINPRKTWSKNDIKNYLDYIDSCIMNGHRQQYVWLQLLNSQVPMDDPGLHAIGTLKCCIGKTHCPVLGRAKGNFRLRAKLMYLFIFPYMTKQYFSVQKITEKMWNKVDKATKFGFCRDNSKVGMYHEYIDMVVQFPPTKQEEKIFRECYPKGVPVKPRPAESQLLIELDPDLKLGELFKDEPTTQKA